MNKQLLSTLGTSALLVASMSFTQTAAASHLDPESTITNFDASTGAISFDYDEDSNYDITGDSVTVNADVILAGTAPVGTIYEFVIPNFYDPLPLKTVEVTLVGRNAGATGFDVARVLDIIGADSDFDNGGPALPVLGEFIGATETPGNRVENWEMYPNPDFEIVKIFAPIGFELDSIQIVTQSTGQVPVPAAVWLFGSGLLGLVGVARRKTAA